MTAELKKIRASITNSRELAVATRHNCAIGSQAHSSAGGMIKAYDDALAVIDRAVKKAPALPPSDVGWLPMERVPAKYKRPGADGLTPRILLWFDHTGARMGYWVFDHFNGGPPGWTPTHWMPLPAGPKREKKTKK